MGCFEHFKESGLPWPQVPPSNRDALNASVVIIGGGISGMCLALELLRRKFRHFIIIEKGAGFGGTWRDSKFPGSCCDVFSHLYSFSFEQNTDWSHKLPGQEEMLDYLEGVAQKHHLYRHARFNTAVEEATWSDKEKKWLTRVRVAPSKESEFLSQYTIRSDFLVSAVGQLNQPCTPDFEGMRHFQGKIMHSARWDWSTSLAGKRICLIGTGATAAQLAPELAATAAHLTVAQRSPTWVIPRNDYPIPAWKRALLRWVPPYRAWYRAGCMDFHESLYHAVTQRDTPAAAHLEEITHGMLQRQLPGRKDLHEKLLPRYAPGCKRSVLSDDFYPTLGRDNVTLRTERIKTFTEEGILFDGDDEAEPFDCVVMATGFKSMTFTHPIRIHAPSTTLARLWDPDPAAHLGLLVHPLPNLGLLYGPNSNLAFNSHFLQAEAQSRYLSVLILAVVESVYDGGWLAITPKAEAQERYNAWVQERLQRTSYGDARCSAWWKNPATGRVVNNWPGTGVEYQRAVERVRWGEYDVSGVGGRRLQGTQWVGRVREEDAARIVREWALGSLAVVLGVFVIVCYVR